MIDDEQEEKEKIFEDKDFNVKKSIGYSEAEKSKDTEKEKNIR